MSDLPRLAKQIAALEAEIAAPPHLPPEPMPIWPLVLLLVIGLVDVLAAVSPLGAP